MPENPHWITRKYTLEFLTPAFLGGADQSGQWRTPPFKALLRQWWRVVYAHQHGFQVNLLKMREAEGKLFGNAWLTDMHGDSAASRSLVRLRLSRWSQGRMQEWPRYPNGIIRHPEVEIRTRNSHEISDRISSHLYLGFGPLAAAREEARFSNQRTAVEKGECAELLLAERRDTNTGEEIGEMNSQTLHLMDLYGTVGGRSRNGWGSFRLLPVNSGWPKINIPLRNWREALQLDWPHCIGQDQRGPLIWRTVKEYTDWKELMRDLACLKIALRTQFRWEKDPPNQRHWLSYPVTNHHVGQWNEWNLRLPNSLRFKVRCVNGDPQRLAGVIYHMPCSPPPAFHPKGTVLQQVWEQVHSLLDELAKPGGQRQLPRNLEQSVIEQITGIRLQRSQE